MYILSIFNVAQEIVLKTQAQRDFACSNLDYLEIVTKGVL